jgi:hypothetical protein
MLALGVSGAPVTEAAQIESVTVDTDGHTFRIRLDAVLDAPQPRVYAVLSDYPRLDRLNPTIRSVSQASAPGNAGSRVRSVLDACVWFFCRQAIQVEDVSEPDRHTIVGRVVPGEGDFAAGSFSWRVTSEGTGTRVHYDAVQTPNFWIPPLIGPWAIKRTLRTEFTSSVAVLEHLAQEPAPVAPAKRIDMLPGAGSSRHTR